MNIFELMRQVRRIVPRKPEDDGAPSGGAVATPAASPAAEAPTAAPATPDPGSAAPAAPAEPAKPTSMLEAIEQGLAGQPRDERGRFATKDGQPVAAAPTPAAQPGAAPATPGQPQPPKEGQQPNPEDDLQMPEGLSQRAQERFQKLANNVRELTAEVETRGRQIAYVQETFQQHGIRQEQFEQAAGVIGMLNRGDFAGAQRVLMQQLQQIAVMTGSPVGAVDGLADFPDLRQAVDTLQITEQHALELARSRMQQQAQQQQVQAEQQHRQQAQSEAQAIEAGTLAVDRFCRQMQASDMDFPAIEAQLLPVIQDLLQGVPPQRWESTVKTQYQLLKNAASKFKAAAPAPAPATVLRATGAGSPRQAPNSMFEAMWGDKPPQSA